ncbi:MAG: OmpA family protein [Serratia fonticola]
MPGYAKCALWLLAGTLAALLVWGFLPLSAGHRVALSCAILLVVAMGCLWGGKLALQRQNTEGQKITGLLPRTGFDGALVLVCGEGALMFSGGAEHRQTHQGWYLNTPTPEAFTLAVEWIASTAPTLLNQLSVALCLAPERYQDEEQLRGEIHQWRIQLARSRRRLPGLPNVLLCSYLNGVREADNAAGDWFVYDGERHTQDMTVHAEDGRCVTLAHWGQQAGNGQPRMAQMLWLETLLGWLNAVVIDELRQPQTALPAIPLTTIAVNFTSLCGVENNLWQCSVRERTALMPAHVPADTSTLRALPFPDCLLPLLPVNPGLTPLQRIGLTAGGIAGVFVMTALFASFVNNQRLNRSISDDLAFYQRLSGTPPEPKMRAQQRLRSDEQLLARYQRHGAPLSLGLGLYKGMTLYPPVQRAISDWVSPTPPALVEHTPQTVRLDSLSLFDTGKAVLKPGSTKVLVSALLNIKAKPGWLIVATGHTDSTGDAQTNQQLSLKRAEAVRDWMLHTSDVSPTCFAVQGYGANRPVANNDTEAGRAANRRVEISLVPQADACQVADSPPASSAKDDALTQKMEK